MNKTYATYREFYEREVQPYFGFLVSGYGFTVITPPENTDLREVWFAFKNGSREIRLCLDQGAPPYVLMTERVSDNERQRVVRLDHLIRQRCPKRKVKRPRGWCGPEVEIGPFIDAYGSILAEEFRDLLANE